VQSELNIPTQQLYQSVSVWWLNATRAYMYSSFGDERHCINYTSFTSPM